MEHLLKYIQGLDPTTVYLVYSPTAVTEPRFPARGYAGPSGRLDEIARVMLATLHVDSAVLSILMGPPSPPKCLLYNTLHGRVASERHAVEEIRRAMIGKPSQMVKITECGFDESVLTLHKLGYTLYLLEEGGSDVGEAFQPDSKYVLVMGAQVDIPGEEIERVKHFIKHRISIGPRSYQAHQVVTFLEWFKSLKRTRTPGSPGD